MHILRTPRLLLRELQEADSALLAAYSREDTAQRELPDEVLADEAAARSLIRMLRTKYPFDSPLVYAIELAEQSLLIGHLSLSPIPEGTEIGYAIGEAFQGQGYAAEAVTAFSPWAKAHLGLRVLYGLSKTANTPSCRVLEKAGYHFQKEEVRKAWGREVAFGIYTI